jgi:serine/threonine-protein kinase
MSMSTSTVVCPACAHAASADLGTCPRCRGALRDPLLGTVLGDRYRILARLGTGGMGAVYRAEHLTLKRDVAVKVLLPEMGNKEEFVRRFQREAESASRLAHINIISVTDFGRTPDGLLFLVMEYLDGEALSALIRRGPIALPRAVAIFGQILDGLGHAHAAGIVHRDLKPDNIMLVEREGRSDVVKLLDFGIAKVTDPEGHREALTQAGVIFGTPEYLSPEQALGEGVDARADLYAAGVILYEMLTGRRPFESDDKVKIISMHLSHPVPGIETLDLGFALPAPVTELVMQSLEKPREHRFSSAAAFRSALAEAVAASPPPVVSPSPSAGGSWAQAAVTRAGGDGGSPRRDAASRLGAPQPRGDGAVQSERGSPVAGHPSSHGSARSSGLSRSPVTWMVLAIAAAVGLGGLGWLALGRRASGPPRSPVVKAAVPSVAPAPPELAAQLRVVEAWLAAAETAKARVSLEELLAQHPRDARVRYLLGRVAFAEDRRAQALDSYREAIALDPGFRADAVLLEHLDLILTDPRNDGRGADPKAADAALELAIERVGRPATELLVRVANAPGDVDRRRKAALALDELGEGARVDRVSLAVAALKRAASCEDRKPLVVQLGNSQDLRALAPLRGLRPRSGLGGLFAPAPDASCMKAELDAAIQKLEERLPPERKTTRRSSNRKSGAHGSLMRGR